MGVPVISGGSDAAPKASVLPIPFDLQSPKPARNALLAQLLPKIDPISMLASGTAPIMQQPPPAPRLVDDQKFNRLAKVNKLREMLRTEMCPQFTDNYDLILYMEQKCMLAGLELAYCQFEQAGGTEESYYGELVLESFRLTSAQAKKRKKCKYAAFKNAYDILTSKSELAVKAIMGDAKRPANLVASSGSAAHINFDYELYRIDPIDNDSSMTTTTTATTTSTTAAPPLDLANMVNLNEMLRTLMLPKENATQQPTVVPTASTGQTDDNDDDDDENKSLGSEKERKSK